MYQTSSVYDAANNAMSRTFRAKVMLGNTELEGIKKIRQLTGGDVAEEMAIGSAVSASVEIQMTAPSVKLENKEIQVAFELEGERVPAGSYLVEKPEKSAGFIKFTAYDRMYWKGQYLFTSALNYPTTTKAVLQEVADQLGVPLDTSGITDVRVEKKPEGYTVREVAGYMAGMHGKNAFISRDGKLKLAWYTDHYTVDFDRSDEPETAEYDYEINKLSCYTDKETELTAGSGTTGIFISNPFMTQEALDSIYTILGGYHYRSGSISLRLGDVRLDPWDAVMVERNGERYHIPCMSLIHEFDGGVTTSITAYAKTETSSESGYKGPTITEIERIYSQLLLVKEVVAGKITAEEADIRYAAIENLNATNASIENLRAEKLSVTDATLQYANIGFTNIGSAAMEYLYAMSGLIKNVTVGDMTISGELAGVTIKGDLIEANTVVADKLVIKGDDGLYYRLNTDGIKVEAQQTEYNSLNGSIIIAKSIAATKITVNDLVAFDATIGGFQITDRSIYSGVKESSGNTTRGIFLGSDGQFAAGDGSNYVKYYKDENGVYKLEVSADNIMLESGKTVQAEISEAVSGESSAIKTEISNTYTGSKIASLINQSADTIKIAATHLELSGAITISSFDSDALSTIKGYSTTALKNAKAYASSAVNWVTANGTEQTDLLNMVKKWTDDAVSTSTLINGGYIKTGTITANKLAIGDFNNYATANEYDESTMTIGDNGTSIGTNHSGPYLRKKDANNTQMALSEGFINPFQTGDIVHIDLQAYCKQTCEFVLLIAYYDTDNTYMVESPTIALSITQANTFNKLSGELQISIPADCRRVKMFLSKLPEGVQFLVRRPRIQKKMSGELLIDGTLTVNDLASIGKKMSVGDGYIKSDGEFQLASIHSRGAANEDVTITNALWVTYGLEIMAGNDSRTPYIDFHYDQDDNADATDYTARICSMANDHVAFYGRNGGACTVQAAIFNYSGLVQNSDRRLKQKIHILDPETSERFLLALKPSEYAYNDDPERIHHGFIYDDTVDAMQTEWALKAKTQIGGIEYGALSVIEIVADMVNVIQKNIREQEEEKNLTQQLQLEVCEIYQMLSDAGIGKQI